MAKEKAKEYFTVYLSLGSNLGDRLGHLRKAVHQLTLLGDIRHISLVYESEAWGYTDPNPYLNMACELSTCLELDALHKALLEIENKAGRLTKTVKSDYAARTLDIDILFYGDRIIQTEDLIVPHPRLEMRRFVLLPLSEIAAHFKHPVSGKELIELLKESSDNSVITRYPDEL